MGKEPDWKVKRQPGWLVAALKRTINELPGSYAEAAEWLGVTEHSLFNRLRDKGDQIFPLGWALVLQQAADSHHIADAVACHSNGVFVPLQNLSEVENADINQRLMEAVEWIGRHSQKVREAIADGLIDEKEKAVLDETSYQVMVKWQEHITLLYRVFCCAKRVNAPGSSPERSGATKSVCGEIIA